MTKEEIKERYSMRDILDRYQIKTNKKGFALCPFHKEKTPSMKIDRNRYHCFGCGEDGDIFEFVQRMEGISFKEAFLSLGGIYEEDSFEAKMARYRSKKHRLMQEKERERLRRRRELNHTLIDVYRHWMNKSEPLSEVWCDCYNALQYQLYMHEQLDESR